MKWVKRESGVWIAFGQKYDYSYYPPINELSLIVADMKIALRVKDLTTAKQIAELFEK